jgi:hypothetical protein
VIGLILIIAGFALVLLPLALQSYQYNGWGSATVISMLVIGGLSVAAFIVYEKYFARKSFIPFYLLKDKSVIGACP